MIDPEDFVAGFLYHAQSKEKVSAYNREYYKRNKHKWKSGKRTIDRSGPVFQQGKGYVKPRSKSEARTLEAEKRIARARKASRKLSPKKRNAVQKKLDAAEKKLKASKNKIKNPFKTKTIDRSHPVRRIR